MSFNSSQIYRSPVFRLATGVVVIIGAVFISLFKPITGVMVASAGGWLIGGLQIYVEWKEIKKG
jgi:hypothetical protein